MTYRSQCVKWNGTQSDNLGISIDVPQGSILGPLSFILYVNDYPDCLQCSSVHMYMYADDRVTTKACQKNVLLLLNIN